jgi:hypothetical protein
MYSNILKYQISFRQKSTVFVQDNMKKKKKNHDTHTRSRTTHRDRSPTKVKFTDKISPNGHLNTDIIVDEKIFADSDFYMFNGLC